MGWERKRGKLEELNRLLLGEQGRRTFLPDLPTARVRCRRTCATSSPLDADTRMPGGAVKRPAWAPPRTR